MPMVGRLSTITANPAHIGFSQPNGKAIANTITMARPVLMASLAGVDNENINRLQFLSFDQWENSLFLVKNVI
jgi:hypothetical protein